MQLNLKGNPFARHPLATVFILALVCLFPAMLTRDFTTSNELRYLSIADEAISGGHVFAFYNHGIPYADKPPLYLWIVMLCRLIFGHHSVLALSLFSVVPAFVTVWLMDRWVMKDAPAVERMAAAMMLLTCVMFLGTMVVVRMDMMMCMFIVLALFSFWRMYSLRNGGEPEGADAAEYRKCSWLLPVWIFLALFTKGPVGLLVPPVSIAVFLLVKRRWRDIPRYLGWKTWGVIVALCAVWFTGVFLDGGVEYLDNLLFKQTMGRAVNAFTHSRPFWFYAVALLWCIAPYTLLLIGSLVLSLLPARRKGNAGTPAGAAVTPSVNVVTPSADVRGDRETFFLCIIISTFVMLSSFSSKLPIYLVPIFPFIVYLLPMVADRKGCGRWTSWTVGIPAAVFVLAGAAAALVVSGAVCPAAAEPLKTEYPFAFTVPAAVASVLLLAGSAISLWLAVRGRGWGLPSFMLGLSMLLAVHAASWTLDEANPYIGYGSISKAVPEGTEVATLSLHRPENIDVYVGRQIKDYGRDVDAFLRDAGEGTPVTLITRKRILDEVPELREYADSAAAVAFSGPYCAVTSRSSHTENR